MLRLAAWSEEAGLVGWFWFFGCQISGRFQ